MSGYDSSDPYAGMIPAYGSADIPDAPAPFDLSADVAMPAVPEPEPEPVAPTSEPQTPTGSTEAPAAEESAPEPIADPADPNLADSSNWTDSTDRADAAERGELAGPAGQFIREALTGMSAQLDELLRLRARDVDLADRLYAENTRLRTGEFAAAVAPLLSGLLRLHDQMTSLADGDAASVAGMLRIQLLQILDTAAGLTPFEPRLGERFDSARHAGIGRAATTDPAAEGTVAKNIKPGFERADGTVLRVAQVEVYRFESR
jgi:molecular chaperone GrpE (heat shock protein)